MAVEYRTFSNLSGVFRSLHHVSSAASAPQAASASGSSRKMLKMRGATRPTNSPPRGAADRDRQVEARQVLGRGPQRGQLAVAEHAGGEQARAVQRDGIADVHHAQVLRQVVGHCAEQHEQGRQRPGTRVPAALPAAAANVEDEDEGQQVEHQRQDPDERHRSDVLRDMAGDREQHQRAERRKPQPERVVRGFWRCGFFACVWF